MRITDNRQKWSEKVLSKKVPYSDMEEAKYIMINPFIYSHWDIYSKVEPRKIANNWNKPLE